VCLCYLPLHHKSSEEYFFWHRLAWVVPEKGLLNTCVSVSPLMRYVFAPFFVCYFDGTETVQVPPLRRTLASSCCQPRHVGRKTLLLQNPLVLNWGHQLMQIVLYNGCKTVDVCLFFDVCLSAVSLRSYE